MKIPPEAQPFINGLAEISSLAQKSKGRKTPEDDIVDPFFSDELRILNSFSLRRLADKAQVFPSPASPHTLTRLSHTAEVVSFAGATAKILGLNMFLCRAIAMGHDIGHAPYGHLGESFISEAAGRNFRHEVFGVVLAQEIEGLNLSFEVAEGILLHSKKEEEVFTDPDLPPEYNVAMLADKITYTFSDIEDAMRHGYLKKESLPKNLWRLGENKAEQSSRCFLALLKESCKKQSVLFLDSEEAQIFAEIRNWMYKNFYLCLDKKIQEVCIQLVYDFLRTDETFTELDPAILLALMTDREVDTIGQMAFRFQRPNGSDVRNFGFMEIVPSLKGRCIDWTDPKLDWQQKDQN